MWDELEKIENLDILSEVLDLTYINRSHATRSTYAKGCRGPLCTKAERDRGRERHATRQAKKGKKVTTFPPTKEQARDEFLNKVIAWHKLVRSEPLQVSA
jgi:hypothetical protein